MRPIGSDRVADLVRLALREPRALDAVTPDVSIFVCGDLLSGLRRAPCCRLVLPSALDGHRLLGSKADRAARNRLHTRWMAARVRRWIGGGVEVRPAPSGVPQGAPVVREQPAEPVQAFLGGVALTSNGLGLTPATR